jgi:hypothetical protein
VFSYLQYIRAYPILLASNDANKVAMSVLRIVHVHIYVNNIAEAEGWYKDVLGFIRDESLLFWFTQGGPLVIKNNEAALSLIEMTSYEYLEASKNIQSYLMSGKL